MLPMVRNGFIFCVGAMNWTQKIHFMHWLAPILRVNLRPPFNDEKRAEAGLPLDFYWPIAVT